MGHNFGSNHDEDMDCAPDYIMSESGLADVDNPQFSSCSTDEIYEHMRKGTGFDFFFCFETFLGNQPLYLLSPYCELRHQIFKENITYK